MVNYDQTDIEKFNLKELPQIHQNLCQSQDAHQNPASSMKLIESSLYVTILATFHRTCTVIPGYMTREL